MTTSTDTTTDLPVEHPHAAYIAGVRALADFYETNPQLVPARRANFLNCLSITDDPKAEMARFIRAGLAAGAKITKSFTDKYGEVLIDFGGGVTLNPYAPREQVCERVVTGTETITREVPDPELLAQVPTTIVTETVETVTWECLPLLASATA